jgi:DNA-binding MarR family transcriptional regulator
MMALRPRTGGSGIDPDRPETNAGRALFELGPRLTRLENEVLRAVTPPLTFRQFRLLERVDQGQTTVTELGRSATITLPAISESVDGLVTKGLLVRRANELDRRESRLSLTEAGQRALKEATGLLAEMAEEALVNVPPARRAALARDLRTITAEVTRALLDSRAARSASS